ncbi:MAG: DEAD/DEAH box helicase [Coleofasciculaceae cyanobacterium SM2_1_6]|nr:DEAD/DEAH box helicase [Coleofasciculaceae cyanobacterium SM2_1_6]
MKILHGTWIPDRMDGFVQQGNFYIWVETTEATEATKKKQTAKSRSSKEEIAPQEMEPRGLGQFVPRHPASLAETALRSFLFDELGIKDHLLQVISDGRVSKYAQREQVVFPKYFLLPTSDRLTVELQDSSNSQSSPHDQPQNLQPLPSLELARYLEVEIPETFDLQYWRIDCYRVTAEVKVGTYNYQRAINIIKLLNDLHFIAINNLVDVQLGADLLFWYHYTQAFKQVIFKDQYIPALKYQEREIPGKGSTETTKTTKTTAENTTKTKKTTAKSSAKTTPEVTPIARTEIYPGWEIVSETYEAELQQYVEYMPLACVAGVSEIPSHQEPPQFFDRQTLLRHFSESLLHNILTHTPSTAKFDQQVADSLLTQCLNFTEDKFANPIIASPQDLTRLQQWQAWQQRIKRSQGNLPFYLCFQLEAPQKEEEPWQLQFQVAPKQDPSLKMPLSAYWNMGAVSKRKLQEQFGQDFEQNLLINLGYAARIYEQIWQGLETNRPMGLNLNLDQAFEFLKEAAWVLEDAGYKVIVPAWWTPMGRRRAKMRLKASGKTATSGKTKAKSYFGFDQLVTYEYELAIGEESISVQEWEKLVHAKAALVKFRGEWMELDRDKMQEMLTFWQQHGQENPEMSLIDFMKLTASDPDLEVDRDGALAEMMAKLQDKQQFEPIENPPLLNGTLREYQRRGVAWLQYLENLGLNGCLADDMGLGKTVQIIARLVNEKAEFNQDHQAPGDTPVQELPKTTKGRKTQKVSSPASTSPESNLPHANSIFKPTLLIAPTSVVGNWRKEVEKFAPHLRAIVHHGSDRIQEAPGFQTMCQNHDLIITSFTLIRKDEALFSKIQWHRIVIDEAQNIKNPKAAQTKAILKLEALHRLALTGTPVENRLLDLWSIFNFLNPGYLGKEAQFKKSFETPIQKNNDPVQAGVLKKLVEPFILRRVKTDKSIIKDLPDKVEQKLYANLTKEQASLYEAVVKDVEEKLNEVEGIQRKGLILSTLLKLKQICNHPRQFLQDGSDFTPERSHKLSRLSEMVEEAISEGESLLIFTQFTEIGDALEKYFRQKYHYNTYYIHGGTNRDKRERMISEFQDPETGASVFILSLKAGGVGITLTKANHVFHFDRWWNPAVEDQATDRAFRIGQQKNVFVHKFVTIGSLEEKIDEMIEDKKKLAGAIVGADESWLSELDNDTFKKLIALNKNAIME